MMDIEKIIILENQISDVIKSDNGCSVNFHYEMKNGGFVVKVFTVNPLSKEVFLLASSHSSAQDSALSNILSYVKSHKNNMCSYTVKWSRKDNPKMNVSYFYCKDARELVDKFYEGKDEAAYIIYEITLNPVS